MNNEERQELIERAMALVEEAQQLVDEAVEGTEVENNYFGYGRYGFDRLLGNGNPYDASLESLLENLQD